MNLSWQEFTIKDVCESVIDCVNKTAPVVKHETPYRMIRTTNVKNGVIDTENVRYVEKETYDKWTRRAVPEVGDVILTREAPLGDVGMLTKEGENIFLGQRLMQYRVNPLMLDSHFLLYALQERYAQGQLKAAGSGSTVEHIRVGDAENLKLRLPDLECQKELSGILRRYDNLIENNNRRIAILEEMAQSLYREWFVKFRFPGHEQCRFVDSSLGPIPEGWDEHLIGAVVDFKRRSVKKGMLGDPVPYMGLEHFPRRSFCLSEWDTVSEIGSSKLQFEKGDILFGKIRPYFHKVGIAQTSGLCSSDTFVFSAKKTVHSELIAMVAFSDQFVAHAVQTSQGTKMPRANWSVLSEYRIAIPPTTLLQKFNPIISGVIEQVRILSLQTRNLKTQRDLLLPKLISGQIDLSQHKPANT